MRLRPCRSADPKSAMRQRHDSVQSAASMNNQHEQRLRSYADLTVRVGLNLQPHQRVPLLGPRANGGAALEAAPVVHHITAAAYAAGVRLVGALWGDEAMLAARLAAAPPDC